MGADALETIGRHLAQAERQRRVRPVPRVREDTTAAPAPGEFTVATVDLVPDSGSVATGGGGAADVDLAYPAVPDAVTGAGTAFVVVQLSNPAGAIDDVDEPAGWLKLALDVGLSGWEPGGAVHSGLNLVVAVPLPVAVNPAGGTIATTLYLAHAGAAASADFDATGVIHYLASA